MEMAGERRIAAPAQKVWEALNDPAVLRACIPGCQSLERDGDDRFNAVAEVKIGPIGARFKGAVALSDLDPPRGYTISGQGSGGVAGNAKGTAKVRLSPDGAGTLLSYTVEAQVGGRMAQLGGPLIDATARQMAAGCCSSCCSNTCQRAGRFRRRLSLDLDRGARPRDPRRLPAWPQRIG